MWWLTPPTDLSPQSEPVADTQAVVAQREEAQALAEAEREEDEEELVDTEALGLEEGEARDIVIDNQLFTAVLSTRGATLRSFELKDHCNFDQESEYSFRSKDRKSTRLNSSHVAISYAVFCLKKLI